MNWPWKPSADKNPVSSGDWFLGDHYPPCSGTFTRYATEEDLDKLSKKVDSLIELINDSGLRSY